MFIRALDWSPAFQGCLLEPVDCLQGNLAQHLSWDLGLVDEGGANTANGFLYQALDLKAAVLESLNQSAGGGVDSLNDTINAVGGRAGALLKSW